MEIEMRASRLAIVAGLAGLVIAALSMLVPQSFARDRYSSAFDAYSGSYAGRAAIGYHAYTGPIPRDYRSSHICINGYRWITRQLDTWEDAARHAVPVRCR
jgi:hypothetical protein